MQFFSGPISMRRSEPPGKRCTHIREAILNATSDSLFINFNLWTASTVTWFLFRCWSWAALNMDTSIGFNCQQWIRTHSIPFSLFIPLPTNAWKLQIRKCGTGMWLLLLIDQDPSSGSRYWLDSYSFEGLISKLTPGLLSKGAKFPMNIYFLMGFFLPIAEILTRPDPNKSMAAGSEKVIMTSSMSMRPARALPTIKNKTKTTKRSTIADFFISFPLYRTSWTVLRSFVKIWRWNLIDLMSKRCARRKGSEEKQKASY